MRHARLRMSAAYVLRDFPDGGQLHGAVLTTEGDLELLIEHPTLPERTGCEGEAAPLVSPRFSARGFDWGMPE